MPITDAQYSVYDDRTDSMHNLPVPRNKKLFYYATSAGREVLKSDYLMQRRDINVYMINYVVRGHGLLTTDGRATELKDGDLTFLHLVKPSTLMFDADGSEIIYFHVNGAQTEDIYNAFLENGDNVIHDVDRQYIERSLKEFTSAKECEDGFYEQSRVLYGVLTEILRLRNLEIKKSYPQLIDEIMIYIFYTCPSPSQKDVARHFGFNPVYLERLFKQYTGETMRAFILRQKYAFACRFLADTDMSVSEIARRVGYADSKGLIALFSKFGQRPLAYRKEFRRR